MNTVFRLPLAPPETLGRRFQYALLSINTEIVRVDPTSGYAEFNSPTDYVELIEKALHKLSVLIRSQKERCNIIVRGINCCGLDRGPTLYRAGQGDPRILANAGFTTCRAEGRRGGTMWLHAAVSYADIVLSRGSPLEGRAPGMPWLAKATLFSKVRQAGGGIRASPPDMTLDTLGSILLGGALAFMGTYALTRRQGRGERLEFFIVPEVPHQSFDILRDIMISQNVMNSIPLRATKLVNELPVSTEVALALLLATEVASKYGEVRELSSSDLIQVSEFEKIALMITVTPQQRPMLRSAIPLSLILYFSYSNATLKRVLTLAWQAIQYGDRLRGVVGFSNVVGLCINSLYMNAVNPCDADHITHCIRGLEAMADALSLRGLHDISSLCRNLVESLALDSMEMIKRRCIR